MSIHANENSDDTGDQAYRLYCRCRYGHLLSLETFIEKIAQSSGTSLLLWRGYYGSSLFYSNNDPSHKPTSKVLFKELFPLLKSAVEDGECDPHVQYLLGWCYHNGEGVVQDNREAVRLFVSASEKGLAIAQSNLGICFDNGESVVKDEVEAVRLYRMAAKQGHAPAQYNLGLSFFYGHGCDVKFTQAANFLRDAADQGFAPAQCMLGMCFETGKGVLEDMEQAVRWYRLASDQKYPTAIFYLAQCYEYGQGVTQNCLESVRLYHMAAELEMPEAQHNLAVIYMNGTPEIPENYSEALRLCRQAVKNRSEDAMYMLGWMYTHGIGVNVDVIEAVRSYSKAAKLGHAASIDMINMLSDAHKEAVWSNRRAFLMFLAHFQFIYRPPSADSTVEDSLASSLHALRTTELADPDIVHAVFHIEDLRRVIMGFL